MARIGESVIIDRPVGEVFIYTTEANSWSKWQSIILEAEQMSEGSVSIGTKFKGICRMMGLSMRWTANTTEHEPYGKWAKIIICGPMTIEEQVTYEPVDEGTKFTIVYDMNVGGFLKILSPIVVRTLRKETKKSLGTLKNILEAKT